MQIVLTPWQRFLLWADDDATKLGMDVGTYFGLCALNGTFQALAMIRYWGWQ